MNKGLKIFLIIVAVIVIIAVIGITVAYFAVNKIKNADEYNVSGDVIPSIKSVLGEVRNLSSVSTSIENGITKKEYKYTDVENVNTDIYKYIIYLMDNKGYINTTDYDLSKATGTLQLGATSVDEGQLVLIDIDYSLKTYTITITKGEGTLTIY